jgi:hypothetical protein
LCDEEETNETENTPINLLNSHLATSRFSGKLNIYDMTIGRDLLHELGIDLLFSTKEMKWDQATVPMRDPAQLPSRSALLF